MLGGSQWGHRRRIEVFARKDAIDWHYEDMQSGLK